MPYRRDYKYLRPEHRGPADCPSCGRRLPVNGHPVIDLYAKVLILDGRATRLELKQAQLLHILIDSMPQAITKERLVCQMYGSDTAPTRDSLNVYICKLRKKIAHTRLRIWTSGVGRREEHYIAAYLRDELKMAG